MLGEGSDKRRAPSFWGDAGRKLNSLYAVNSTPLSLKSFDLLSIHQLAGVHYDYCLYCPFSGTF